MQGSLQSITNTTATRNGIQTATPSQTFVEMPPKVNINVTTLADTVDVKKTKTPSPKKVAIRVEPPSGKENFAGTPQSID